MTNNLETLRKLSLGKDDKTTVKINFEEEDYEFEMRPLTDGELTKLQSIEKKPLVVKVGNTGEFTEAQNESMYQAIGWSMDVPLDVVKGLPAGLPGVLFEQVIRISKLSDDDLTIIKSFRKDE